MPAVLRQLARWARVVRDAVERPVLVRLSVAVCFGSMVFLSARFHHSSHGAVDDPVRIMIGAVVMVGLLWTLRRVADPHRYARRRLLGLRRLPWLVLAIAGVLVMVRCTSLALAGLAHPGAPWMAAVGAPALIAVGAAVLVNGIVARLRRTTAATQT